MRQVLRCASRTLSVSLVFAGVAVAAENNSDAAAEKLATQVLEAHNQAGFAKAKALQFEIDGRFGQSPLKGKFTVETTGPRARLELPDGTIVFHNGQECRAVKGSSPAPDAELRFHVLTWPWFAMSPFKIIGPGTFVRMDEELTLNGQTYSTIKQTFGSGQGDTPDDWYLLYIDPKTHQLVGQAYIVTYGKDLKAAEGEPHAIVYSNYEKVASPAGEVLLSTDWKFYDWSREQGVYGDPLGQVAVKGYKLISVDSDLLTPPESAETVAMPQPQAGK